MRLPGLILLRQGILLRRFGPGEREGFFFFGGSVPSVTFFSVFRPRGDHIFFFLREKSSNGLITLVFGVLPLASGKSMISLWSASSREISSRGTSCRCCPALSLLFRGFPSFFQEVAM